MLLTISGFFPWRQEQVETSENYAHIFLTSLHDTNTQLQSAKTVELKSISLGLPPQLIPSEICLAFLGRKGVAEKLLQEFPGRGREGTRKGVSRSASSQLPPHTRPPAPQQRPPAGRKRSPSAGALRCRRPCPGQQGVGTADSPHLSGPRGVGFPGRPTMWVPPEAGR